MEKHIRRKILHDVRLYPSPHNSQPIRLRFTSNDRVDVYYDLDCGLPAEAYGIEFGYVCAGVFLASLQIVAAYYGYDITDKTTASEMDFTSSNRLHLIAHVTFKKKTVDPEDREQYRNFMRRQTSRIPYKNKLVDPAAIDAAKKVAAQFNQILAVSSDQQLVDKVIAINQRTLFYELENDAVYNELMTWLRFSESEAREKADGLSARTMLIPGWLLRFILTHRYLWRAPVIGSIVRGIYLRTMRGVRQVAWITGRFQSYADYIQAGKCFMNIWITLTKYNIYIHPYGTVITNPRSHAEFIQVIEGKEDNTMTWMLFRLGYSDTPPKSYRRDVTAMLIEEN